MAEIPDFRTRTPSVDPMAFANVLQRKAQIEQQNELAAQELKDKRIMNIIEGVKAGQQIANNMMDLAEKRNKQKGLADLTNLMTKPAPTPPNPIDTSPEALTGYNTSLDARKRAMTEALARANPESFTKEASESIFREPKETDKITLETKQILHNGEPSEALFDKNTGNFYDPTTKQQLTGKIEPYSMGSPYADIRKQALIQRTSESMGKDLNELSINSNSPAGISAKRALYSKSGLNLIKQAESQPGGVDKRQMAELQMEVARVLTGAGVITNDQLNSLATRTARSKVANWEEWISNKPTGTNQQEFVKRFKETLQRQLQFHGGELDKNKQKAMAKYANFAQKYPEEFNAVLDQAGYDTKEFHKTKKLVPLFDNTPDELKDLQLNTVTPEKFKGWKVVTP